MLLCERGCDSVRDVVYILGRTFHLPKSVPRCGLRQSFEKIGLHVYISRGFSDTYLLVSEDMFVRNPVKRG